MNNYLCNYGVLGMKWGVRRYQNPDGTLTAEGRKRYGVDVTGKKYRINPETGTAIGTLNPFISSQRRASRIVNNLENMSKDRKNRMSARQQQSYNKAMSYWKSVEKGEKPAQSRNIIKRQADMYRSYSLGERFAIQTIKNVAENASYNVNAAALNRYVGEEIAYGKRLTSGLITTPAWALGSEELHNRIFGHF